MIAKLRLMGVALALVACTGETSESVAQPVAGGPAETGEGNGAGYKPAFEHQTRAPQMKANVAFDVVDVVASGIDTPFAFAFLPDGRYLITERLKGQLRVASASGALSPPVTGLPRVTGEGQGGLLDVVLAPDFATSGMIYWSYSEPGAQNGVNNTAVARGKLVDGAAPRLEAVQVIYHQTPSLRSNAHFGSRLTFLSDGTLLVSQGERSSLEGRMQSQDLKSLLGKVVRINADGSVPADNPFVGRADADPKIWSYGHRNVQGMDIHPASGEVWTMEHGPRGGDELNIARKGKDYGWPTISYGAEYRGGPIGQGQSQAAGMEQPVYYWDPVIAPGAIAFYDANLFPAWKGSLFVAGMGSGYIARLTLDGDKVIGEERLTLSEQGDRHRDIDVGPDGALYVLVDDGTYSKLVKLVPKAA